MHLTIKTRPLVPENAKARIQQGIAARFPRIQITFEQSFRCPAHTVQCVIEGLSVAAPSFSSAFTQAEEGLGSSLATVVMEQICPYDPGFSIVTVGTVDNPELSSVRCGSPSLSA